MIKIAEKGNIKANKTKKSLNTNGNGTKTAMLSIKANKFTIIRLTKRNKEEDTTHFVRFSCETCINLLLQEIE